MNLKSKNCILALMLTLSGGCPSSTSVDIDASPADPDASPVEIDASTFSLPPLSFDLGELGRGPADLSCLDVRATPVGAEDIAVTMAVIPFGAPPNARVPGATVQIFRDNLLTPNDTCPAPQCEQHLADELGEIGVVLPRGSWFSYRVLPIGGPDPGTTFLRTIETNVSPPEPNGRPENFNTISLAVTKGLAAQAGADQKLGTSILSGVVLDCQGRPLRGAIVRVFGSDGGELTSDVANAVYFANELPPSIDPTRAFTSANGRYAAVQVTADPAVRVEVWGIPTTGDAPQLIACEPSLSLADSLSVLPLLPVRIDALEQCGSSPLP